MSLISSFDMVIGEAYRFFDDAIMYGVNKTVYAWNWTTGRPKEDLANVLTIVGNAAFCGSLCYRQPKISFFVAPSNFLWALGDYLSNTTIAEKERRALDKGLLDLNVEKNKKNRTLHGYVYLVGGTYIFSDACTHNPDYPVEDYICGIGLGTGMALIGVSNHVMRANPLSPRKNCFSRGADKLADLIESLYGEPATNNTE